MTSATSAFFGGLPGRISGGPARQVVHTEPLHHGAQFNRPTPGRHPAVRSRDDGVADIEPPDTSYCHWRERSNPRSRKCADRG